MHVNELLERILEISHDEVAPDTNLKQKSLRWLNSAYHEIMEVVIPFLPTLEHSLTLNVVNGYVELPADLNRIISVSSERAFVSKNDFKQVFKGGKLNLYFNKNEYKKITLSYTKKVSDLAFDGVESSILIPQQYHSYLVWGALVWASVYERGFNNQAELRLFQQKWEEAKREIKLSLAANLNLSTTHQDVF